MKKATSCRAIRQTYRAGELGRQDDDGYQKPEAQANSPSGIYTSDGGSQSILSGVAANGNLHEFVGLPHDAFGSMT